MSSFLHATFRPVALLIVSAFVVVGCGGNGKSTTVVIEQPQSGQPSFVAGFNAQRARGQDAEAKSNARNMVSQLESCSVDYAGSYTHCANLRNTGLPIGAGSGQVEVQTARITYSVTAHSRSGNTFRFTKKSNGVSDRTCEVQAEPGGCLGGAW